MSINAMPNIKNHLSSASAPQGAPPEISQDILWNYIMDPDGKLGQVVMFGLSDNGERLYAHAPNTYLHDPDSGEFLLPSDVELSNTYKVKDEPFASLPEEVCALGPSFREQPVTAIRLRDVLFVGCAWKDHVYLAKDDGNAVLIDKQGYLLVAFDTEQNSYVMSALSEDAFLKGYDYSNDLHQDPGLILNYISDLQRLLGGEMDRMLNRSIRSKGLRIEAIINALNSGSKSLRDIPGYSDEIYAKSLGILDQIKEWRNALIEKISEQKAARLKGEEVDYGPDPWLATDAQLAATNQVGIFLSFVEKITQQKKDAVLNINPQFGLSGGPITIAQDAPIADLVDWTEKVYGHPLDFEAVTLGTHEQTLKSYIVSQIFPAKYAAMENMLKHGTFDPEEYANSARQIFLDSNPKGVPQSFLERYFSTDSDGSHDSNWGDLYIFISRNRHNEFFEKLDDPTMDQIIEIYANYIFSSDSHKERVQGFVENSDWFGFLDWSCSNNEPARRAMSRYYDMDYRPYTPSSEAQLQEGYEAL